MRDISRSHSLYQDLGVDQDMPFAAHVFLHPVVVVLRAQVGGLDRLAVDRADAGLGSAAQVTAQIFAEVMRDPLPGPIRPPAAKIVIRGLPGGPFLR